MTTPVTPNKHRGRPKGRETVRKSVALLPEQQRDLDVLSAILDGNPSMTGLVRTAVGEFIDARLRDAKIKKAYDERINRRLQLVKDDGSLEEGQHG
jgi:hypothetical protein